MQIFNFPKINTSVTCVECITESFNGVWKTPASFCRSHHNEENNLKGMVSFSIVKIRGNIISKSLSRSLSTPRGRIAGLKIQKISIILYSLSGKNEDTHTFLPKNRNDNK